MFFKYLRKFLVFAVIFQLVGCDMVSINAETTTLEKVIAGLERDAGRSKARRDETVLTAKSINKIAKEIRNHLNHPPKLKGKLSEDAPESYEFVKTNGEKLTNWIKEYKNKSQKLMKIVHSLGSKNYETNEDFLPVHTQKEIIKNEALIFFSLQYLKKFNTIMLDMIAPMTIGSMQESYKNIATLENFSKEIQDNYFTFLGLHVVLNNDLAKTTKNLGDYRERNNLPRYIRNAITITVKRVKKADTKRTDSMANMQEHLGDENFTEFLEIQKDFIAKLETKSILFDPNNPDSIVSKIFVVILNLTWGLPNTLIGVGIILATAIVSPFTPYVDFPTFNISASGQQIYVDTSGMGPMAGKMSMGLFEFDNHAGYHFASGHEAGHSKQSALLGPFYLPAVLLSYSISGFDQGFIEDWAWGWAVD
ncbi:hypothetical protein A9Q84_01050 [Halobacteriovorax marinus]|uniref:Uncharacterized protein n=1 Tax=Halobacteriovorax marinus TaxID=97084 RepID=A0A1Y5FC29_9BACT|nr:hypothetical protein A9Q84_01050 [Halobacteriovorax marinus]